MLTLCGQALSKPNLEGIFTTPLRDQCEVLEIRDNFDGEAHWTQMKLYKIHWVLMMLAPTDGLMGFVRKPIPSSNWIDF